jgi:hypothetical protein
LVSEGDKHSLPYRRNIFSTVDQQVSLNQSAICHAYLFRLVLFVSPEELIPALGPATGVRLGVRADTISTSVTGQYDHNTEDDDVLHLKRGYSKEQRPDLKQFLSGLATVKEVPFYGSVENGS